MLVWLNVLFMFTVHFGLGNWDLLIHFSYSFSVGLSFSCWLLGVHYTIWNQCIANSFSQSKVYLLFTFFFEHWLKFNCNRIYRYFLHGLCFPSGSFLEIFSTHRSQQYLPLFFSKYFSFWHFTFKFLYTLNSFGSLVYRWNLILFFPYGKLTIPAPLIDWIIH